ncbi:MAG: hypothetical protein ACLUOI_26655 [Eisenbergiella sp.]
MDQTFFTVEPVEPGRRVSENYRSGEALPEEEKTPVLISEMACAYNLAEATTAACLKGEESCWNRWKRTSPITDGISDGICLLLSEQEKEGKTLF